MSDGIQVTVIHYPDRPNLVLAFTDPVSGKRKTKSAGTANKKEAWKAAAKWEAELRSGKYVSASKLTWDDFVTRYTNQKLATLRPRTQDAALGALRHVKRVLDLDKPCKLTAATMSEFQEKLRGEGMKETTLARNCRHIKAALRWGEKMGIVARAPQIEIPRKAKGSQAKSRGVTGEEFERMLAAVPAIRPKDAQEWQRFLTGVWHSGLRLSEAVGLTWHSGLFCLDVSGRLPSFVIEPEGQKSDKPEVAPVTPDFVAWLRTTYPDARERDGRVFQLLNLRTGRPMEPHRVGEIVEKIGRKAKIKVGMATKRDKKTGKVVEIPVFAGCHSLRRGFGSKWARRVSPSILKRLMRHSSIATTEGYYVTLNADEVTRELCAEFGQKVAAGNISGNKAPQTSPIADAPQRT